MKRTTTFLILLAFLSICLLSCTKNNEETEPIRQLSIDGVINVDFGEPISSSTKPTLNQTTDANIKYVFDETADLFRVGIQLPYQIVLNAGPNLPIDNRVKATFFLPQTFLNSVPKGHGFEVFALTFQDGGSEEVDLFDIIPSQYNSANGTLTATLPARVFTNKRNTNKTYEAIFMIATTPGTNIKGGRIAAGECLAGQINCPLGKLSDCNKLQKDGFGGRIDPQSGFPAYHWGLDFGVPIGTPIFSASDGKVEKIWTQKDTKGQVAGFGLYMIVRHTNGSGTLYAHLSGTTAKVGQTVKSGEQIAASGNTGKSTGPHLHFEYVPNGQIVQSKGRIDPQPCISSGNSNGSLTIRDNGTLADDAFDLFLNDVLVGSTAIGASNSIALSNLRPGDQTLKITCTIAPDNVGTYEIILADGIVFQNGGSRVSGTIAQGGSQSWMITVPKGGRIGATSTVSLPNAYKER